VTAATAVHIVPLYAAVLALVFVGLSIRTLRMRRSLRIAVGDAGNPAMLRAMRAHANFAEYVPLGLLLVFFVEAVGAAGWVVHALCACLLVGRAVHAWGVSQLREDFRFRVAGMALTFAVLLSSSVYLLVVHAAAIGS
jgi:uncharacterized membrane protein YecN with MAPEG domain